MQENDTDGTHKMTVTVRQNTARRRWRIAVSGTVQGVGFRPFIYQLARTHGLAGWVCNTGDGVRIEVEGSEDALGHFFESIARDAPVLARVGEVQREALPVQGESGFRIRESEGRESVRAGIPPDVATCPDCLADIADPTNRRYRYPFTNCTNCGPRFTIIRAVPYDRPQTTMRDFVMCPDCQAEYEDPGNRRFHAQPNACPICGPQLSLDGGEDMDDAGCITATAALLRAGRILAIKGLGGFHLACDARNPEAVHALRTRKGRAGKPFALMCPDLEEARRLCVVDDASARLLLTPEHPIVLMPARSENGLASQVAPGITTLGIMLPYTPLHQLLLREFGGALVMTSGNLSDEPIAYHDEEARARLGHIADHFLTHNRPIHLACDDSLVRVHRDAPTFIRRARGYVPRPITLAVDTELPQILACGGDLKNTFCITKGKTALLSQHLGDLENPVTLEHYTQAVRHFCDFYAVKPVAIAHDLHPDYHATRFACAQQGVPLLGVQHHHAHIASCMAEHGLRGPVIGVAFDGTGFGTDGTIWGGEFFVGDYRAFRRAAHLAPIALPGGEAAIRRPGRIALAHLLRAGMPLEEAAACVPGLSPAEAAAVGMQIARGLNTPRTSSMGRLFDAVSALLGICGDVTYEGQAAIELETVAYFPAERVYPYHIACNALGTLVVDMTPLFSALVDGLRRHVAHEAITASFHATIAAMTADVCIRLRDETGVNDVALSGGVFQNMLLLGLTQDCLAAQHFTVYRHQQVPCNDGGLSLGQAMIAAERYERTCV
ncbi:MAG TPA: carbamoyltransferase HypF [Armatimonadota bacterium]|jgi:hydrogenase maturation protein HypF